MPKGVKIIFTHVELGWNVFIKNMKSLLISYFVAQIRNIENCISMKNWITFIHIFGQ